MRVRKDDRFAVIREVGIAISAQPIRMRAQAKARVSWSFVDVESPSALDGRGCWSSGSLCQVQSLTSSRSWAGRSWVGRRAGAGEPSTSDADSGWRPPHLVDPASPLGSGRIQVRPIV